ncbi:hypothetical protein GGQ80_000780 [Sphingomonas jinjuensis]|uniref:Uncharacterized protein n=1 Tax=Sphingomonas jinjuensis TaxID=535907 RepID=A0A840F8F7_9SPHN|nr:hypothetical protein [Sphingomonas jinjuensis]MBB4152892.1 hypothetical protein [Sphingomonas jinjuensis]
MAESPSRKLARLIRQLDAFLAAGGQLGVYSDEQARDAIAAALRGEGGLGVAVDGAGDTLTIRIGDAAALRLTLGLGTAALLAGATAAEFHAGTASRALTTTAVWDAAAPVALIDQATIAVDLGAMINGVVTLGGNRTLRNPSRAKPGQSGFIELVQDATGGRQLAFGSAWRNTATVTLSSAAGARDCLYFVVKATDRIEVTGLTRAIG